MMVKRWLVIVLQVCSLGSLVVKVRKLGRDELTDLVRAWIGLPAALMVRMRPLLVRSCLRSMLLGPRARISSILAILACHLLIKCGVVGIIGVSPIELTLLDSVVLHLLLVGNSSDRFKDRQSTDNVLVDQVELVEEWVLRADQPLQQAVDVLLEDLPVADVLPQVSILLLDLHQIGKGQRVDELASLAVGALEVLVILLAELGLVSGGDMLLLLKFMLTMSECTSISVLAFLVLDPTFAEFCLDL